MIRLIKFISLILFLILSLQKLSNANNNSLLVDKISKNLRCLICQGQSVYDSQSDFAISMKILIDNKIKDKFGRDWSNIKTMTKPYYFAKVTGALFHTQGGLDINSLAQVLDKSGKPFPNLFAGGGAARGLSGPSRWGYLSGNGLLTAVVLGKIAGQNAAKKIIGNDC